MADPAYRRVVTGLDPAGQSCVLIDGPVPRYSHAGGGFIWRSASVPADNSGRDEIAVPQFSFDLFHDGGSNFFVVEMEPGEVTGLHTTDTLDYVTMLQGEMIFITETDETVLRAGDFLVDRGVPHSWHNQSAQKAVFVVFTLPAFPVGKGKTA